MVRGYSSYNSDPIASTQYIINKTSYLYVSYLLYSDAISSYTYIYIYLSILYSIIMLAHIYAYVVIYSIVVS